MHDSTLANYIRNGIAFLGLASSEPYCWWRENLFHQVNLSALEEIASDVHFTIALGTPGVWTRIEEVRERLFVEPDERNVASKVNFLSRLYSAFVYPRDSVMRSLVERLPHDFTERRICEYYYCGDRFRHIRNAIAHGHVDFCEDNDNVVLRDREWSEHCPCRVLLLDSMITVDIFVGIFERKRGRR